MLPCYRSWPLLLLNACALTLVVFNIVILSWDWLVEPNHRVTVLPPPQLLSLDLSLVPLPFYSPQLWFDPVHGETTSLSLSLPLPPPFSQQPALILSCSLRVHVHVHIYYLFVFSTQHLYYGYQSFCSHNAGSADYHDQFYGGGSWWHSASSSQVQVFGWLIS